MSFSRLRTDFGRGFYTTPIREQAVSWSERFLRELDRAALSVYEFTPNPDDKLPPETRTLKFDVHSLEWLNFITTCRLGLPGDTEWDLVIGGVANDKVFDTLQLYFDKLIGAEEAIGRLRHNKPNLQYCFKTQSLINNHLEFVDSEVLK